jgi:co-chaperonin GroES (HSP10)
MSVNATVDNFHPLGDRILAKMIREEKTPGGIQLPDNVKGAGVAWRCRAVKVGMGDFMANNEFRKTKIEPGDEFLCPPFPGYLTRIDFEEFVIVREFTEVLGVFAEND